jgi:hypothetical protein
MVIVGFVSRVIWDNYPMFHRTLEAKQNALGFNDPALLRGRRIFPKISWKTEGDS